MPAYPRYPRYPQAGIARIALRDSRIHVRLKFCDEEPISGNGEKLRNVATAEAGGFSSEKQATEAVEGPSRKKREAQADPTFFEVCRNRRLRPTEPQTGNRQVRLTGARWEPTGVARPRPEPRTPRELALMEFTRPGKTPSPHRRGSSDPGQVGADGDISAHFDSWTSGAPVAHLESRAWRGSTKVVMPDLIRNPTPSDPYRKKMDPGSSRGRYTLQPQTQRVVPGVRDERPYFGTT